VRISNQQAGKTWVDLPSRSGIREVPKGEYKIRLPSLTPQSHFFFLTVKLSKGVTKELKTDILGYEFSFSHQQSVIHIHMRVYMRLLWLYSPVLWKLNYQANTPVLGFLSPDCLHYGDAESHGIIGLCFLLPNEEKS